jgi:hypothetical protein
MRLSDPDAQHFIVEEKLIQGRSFLGIISLSWSGQTIAPKAGICQILYRNGTTYAHSVDQNFRGELPRAYKGDCVYSVSLMPRTYNFNGVITTKDGKARSYDMHIEMQVVHATRFMEAYHHSQDPACSVFIQFKQAFEYYASKMEDMTEATLAPWLDRQVAMFSQRYGIQVIHPAWFFHASHEIIRKEDIVQAAQRKKRELDIEYELKIHEELHKGDLERVQKDVRRDEKARQNEFARSEKKKGHVINEQIRLLSSTVTSLIQVNDNRVNDNVGYNLPAQDILKDSLKLLASLNNSLDNSPQEAETILGSTLSNGMFFDEDGDDDEPVTTAHPTASATTNADKDRGGKEA